MSNENFDTTTSVNPDKIDFENAQPENGNADTNQTEKHDGETPKTHEVVLGDDLTSISVKYEIPKDVLIKLNNIEDPNVLTLGQKLRLTDEGQ